MAYFDGKPEDPDSADDNRPKGPDYSVCVRTANEDDPFITIGAAWKNRKGIRIKIHPAVSLANRPDLVLYLFDKDKKTEAKKSRSRLRSRNR